MNRYFQCPDGQTQLISDCTQGLCRMETRCKPLPFLMVAGEEREHTPDSYSVTQLLNGTRENYLKLTGDHDTVIDPSDRVFAILGTSAHSKLEKENSFIIESEVSMSYTLTDKITLTGTADLVEQQPNGELWMIDHKTSGSYKTALGIGMSKYPVGTGEYYKSGAKKGQEKTKNQFKIMPENIDIDDWIKQVNMYRVMFEKQSGLKISKVKIYNMVRDGNTIASKSRGIVDNDYYIDIPLMDDEKIISFYKKKAIELSSFINAENVPPICSEKERWGQTKCLKFCDVSGHCSYGKDIQQGDL